MTLLPAGDTLDRIFKSLVVLTLVITGLILIDDIIIPIAFAALFSVVLLPAARMLEPRTGRILSILIVLLATFLVMMLITWFVINQLTDLVENLPNLQQKFYSVVEGTSQTIKQKFKISTEDQTKMLADGLSNLSSYLGGLLVSTTYLVYFFIQVPIYIFLFLFYRDKFQEFFLTLTPDSELKWEKEVEGVVRGYISGLTIVVIIAGILNGIGLLILGIDNAIFFGFLSGTLTMIPYVGITIGASLPTIMALLTKDSIWYAVGVVAVHTFVQFLEGNFITPRITGSRISVNAMAAILALLLGGKILGIPGMILAVPAIGILKILLSYSTSLRPLVILLGNNPPGKNELTEEEAPGDE